MQKNNFKVLQELNEQEFIPPPEMANNILENMHILQTFGKMAEHFIPNAFDMFVTMLGGATQLLDTNDAEQAITTRPDEVSDTEDIPGDA